MHDAFESTLMSLVYLVWLTDITNMGASAEGAEMMTFLQPPWRCIDAFSIVVKMPVDSYHVRAVCAPRHLVRVADGVEFDGLSIDDQGAVGLVVVHGALVDAWVESYLKR